MGIMAALPMTLLFALASVAPLATSAQEATPAPDLPEGTTVAASGLTSHRGLRGTATAHSTSPSPAAAAPTRPPRKRRRPKPLAREGCATAAVAQIENGCPVAVATGLSSAEAAIGEVLGADDVAFLGGELYVGVDGGGAVHGNPDQPSGVYRVDQDGTFEVVADLSAWVRANPVTERSGDYDPDAGAYLLVTDDDAGLLWIVEPNSGQILTATSDGTVTRVANLSAGHLVPSALALAPEGGVYVGNLTALSYTDGTAKVIHVAPDGTETDVWTGLTTVIDIAVGPDGTLYASELSTDNLEEPPFMVPGSGRVVR